MGPLSRLQFNWSLDSYSPQIETAHLLVVNEAGALNATTSYLWSTALLEDARRCASWAMAEVIGVVASGFTLASLFKVCLDAIDLIQIAQHQDLDVKKLVLKLNIEKCRLYAWGEAIGLTTTSAGCQPRSPDACPGHIQELVRDTLDMTIRLFTDTQELKDRYGCKELSPTEAPCHGLARGNHFGPVDRLATSFSDFKVASRSSEKFARLAQKTKWIIHDRKKFVELVAEVRAFVDGLQDLTQPLTPAVRQESTVRRGVQQISDVESLDLIADVCEFDHPTIADAASERSTMISSAPLHLPDVEQWMSDVVPGLDGELLNLESLTVTELKHRILAYNDELALAEARMKSDSKLRKGLSDMIEIGVVSQKEAVSMRVVSVITMLYLPATFVSVSSYYILRCLHYPLTFYRLCSRWTSNKSFISRLTNSGSCLELLFPCACQA